MYVYIYTYVCVYCFVASPASETLLLDPYWQANKPTFQKEAFPTMPD